MSLFLSTLFAKNDKQHMALTKAQSVLIILIFVLIVGIGCLATIAGAAGFITWISVGAYGK